MKFIRRPEHFGCWVSADEHYIIRNTCGVFYTYEGVRYVGSRDSFDEAKALAEREASK